MPSRFPGPAQPRFRLRRSSRYPSTSYTGPLAGRASYDGGGSAFTRRGLIATGVLLAAAGTTEAIRSVVGGSRSKSVGARGLDGSVAELIEGHPRNPAVKPTVSPSVSTTPSTSGLPTHSHSHSHGHPHSNGGGHTHEDDHGSKRGTARDEPATLPPAQLNVRKSPAYSVDQLIPDAPKHAIALTIDDGPDPLYTPTVLRLLDKYQTQASFCVVGVHAAAYPKLVRDIASAGHILVNHTYSHPLPFTSLPQKRIVAEITKTQSTIEKASGVTPQLFRAPGGDWSKFVFQAIAAYGLEPLDWDVDPRDWALPGTKHIVKAMLKARPGEIVLCHDGGGNRSETVKALRKVLPSWQRRGLATIPLQITPNYLTSATASTPPTTSPSPTSS
jgi:peptidoglycan/xylan/chitin deacetylase (PgdA/CDA1 family)